MNRTDTPRVEVTEEMLEQITRDATAVIANGFKAVHVQARYALALVERIRELEKRLDDESGYPALIVLG